MLNALGRSAALTAVLLSLSGCVSPKLTVTSSGAVPDAGSYAVTRTELPANAGFEQMVADRLENKGFRAAGQPTYLAQVGYSVRAAGTGLVVPGGVEPRWLRAPDRYRKSRLISTLSLNITESRSGKEVYRASASRPTRRRGTEEVPADLLDAVLPALPRP